MHTVSNGQELSLDSSKLLYSERIEVSTNTFNTSPELGNFNDFSSDFKFGNRFITGQHDEFNTIDFDPSVTFSGFNINFLFGHNVFRSPQLNARSKFNFSFEAGRTSAELFRVFVNDTTRLSYEFASNIFRMALGYRYYFTKKDKRLKFHIGVETIHEFNISASIVENQFETDFIEVSGERRLFATKKYGFYLNFPVGIDYRLFRKTIVFLYFNYALGIQNIDPYNITSFQTGSRFGFSFTI